MLNNPTELKNNIYTLFGISLVTFLAFSPILHAYFVYTDDFYILKMEKGVCGTWHQHYFIVDQTARPLLSYIFCYSTYFMDTMGGANIIRAMSVLFLGLTAFVIHLCFRRSNINNTHSILLALSLVALPGFQVQASIVGGLPPIIATFLAVLAFFIAINSRTWGRGRSGKFINRYNLIAFVLLLISFLAYPSTTMFYWVMVAAMILGIDTERWKSERKDVLTIMAINFAAMFVYFIYAKINYYVFINGPKIGYTPQYAISVTTDLIGKFKFFLGDPLIVALNPWKIWPSFKVANLVAKMLAVGFLFAFFQKAVRRSIKMGHIFSYIQKYSLLLFLLPMTFLPGLAAANINTAGFRVLQPIGAFIILLLFWSLTKVLFITPKNVRNALITIVLVPLCFATLYQAHYNVWNYFAFAQTIELRFIKSALIRNDLKDIERIHLLSPYSNVKKPPGEGPVRSTVTPHNHNYREFGVIVGLYWLVIDNVLPDMPLDKQKDMKRIIKNGKVTHGLTENYVPYNEPTLLIDLTRLHQFY